MRGLVATVVAMIMLTGCATKSTPAGGPRESPAPGKPAFAAFTITKTGGFAGVSQRIDVAADGMVRNESGTVLGRIEGADLAELRTLLSGTEIRDEATRPQPTDPGKCADGFNFTLVMGDLRLSDYACGRPSNKPAFNRILELTSGSHLKK